MIEAKTRLKESEIEKTLNPILEALIRMTNEGKIDWRFVQSEEFDLPLITSEVNGIVIEIPPIAQRESLPLEAANNTFNLRFKLPDSELRHQISKELFGGTPELQQSAFRRIFDAALSSAKKGKQPKYPAKKLTTEISHQLQAVISG